MKNREKLIELFETVVSPKEVLCDGEVLVSTSQVVDHLIANGVGFLPKWIPVTERLPEKPGEYLVFSKAGNYSIQYFFIAENYKNFLYVENGTITHWMPLPQPPKGE